MSANVVVNPATSSPVVPAAITVKHRQMKTRRPKPEQMRGEGPLVPGDFLGLPGLRTTAPPEVGDFSILVRAEQSEMAACPYCGCADERYQPSNGTRREKPQELLDEPRGFRRVRIELTRRNFRCESCGASGLLPLWGVREGQRATDRLVSHVEQVSLSRPFAEVELMTGLSRRKVKEVFDGYVGRRLRETVSFEPPRVIGLDGIKIRKKGFFTVITDIERRLVLHMWKYSRGKKKNDRQAAVRSLVTLLKEMNESGQVEVVVMDMSRQYRSAVGKALPQAKIVVDRYHLQRMANEAVDCALTRLNEARREGGKKAEVCHAQVREDFKKVLSAMGNWGEPVFNYFDFGRKPTNAFTEWANRRIRDLRRESRGCGVDVIRAKLIFGTWMRRRMKEGADRWGESTVVIARTRRPSEPKPKKNLGARKPKKTSAPYRIRPTQPSLFQS